MDNEVRLVVGVLGDSWAGNDEEDWYGLLEVAFEKFENDLGESEFFPINVKRHYCDSKKAFVTRNFKSLKEQFSYGQMLLIESEKSNNPNREQGNVVDYLRVQKLPSNQLLEVINIPIIPDDYNYKATLNNAPSTDYVMLAYMDNNSEAQLIGPFLWKFEENEFEHQVNVVFTSPSRTPITGINLSDYYSYQIPLHSLSKYIVEANIHSNTHSFLVNSKSIHNEFSKHGKRIDVMDDSKVLKEYASELLKAKPFNGLTAKSLEILKANINMASKSKKNKPRLFRALQLLQKANDWQQDRKTLFVDLLSSVEGQSQVENYIASHEEEYFRTFRKETFENIERNISDELTKLTLKEKSLRSTIRDLGLDADAKRKEQADMETEYRAKAEDKVRKELEQEKAELQQKVSEIKSELEGYQAEHSLHKTISDLEAKNTQLKSEHAGLTSLNIGLEQTKEDLENSIAAASKQLTDEYIRVHSLFKAMTTPSSKNETYNVFPDANIKNIVPISMLDTPHAARRDYIDAMESTLSKYNRNLSREQVVNLVVTLAQSQFTIFAGLPGSGKTSLVKIIGKAMQLGNRQHTIPVAKAWTSTKDILGYYNGLSGSYHPAPTGLWGLLNSVQGEQPENSLPVLLLLDEMNLSSPEHYFSSFLDLADNESDRVIYTGHPEQQHLHVPEHFKFIGTINQDETVQSLSPRMLDRAAVILFDGFNTDSKLSKEIDLLLPKHPAKDWLDLFSAKGANLPGNINSALKAISDCISINSSELGQRHIISHRKIKQIHAYIEVASSLLIDFDDFISLDYAIAQYILPMISGYGDGYGTRLKNLLDILQSYSMPISSNILKDIICNGEQNLYSYRYLV
ncbi:AAA family ATPase [Vibrio rarus]|uniref:AAA family ATPase n=1 Tax=Vibrio rarus TaxID=413403 RepID=UPI0021C36276|nr:AAA family ATPase [Vibrio rarus]